MTKSKLCIVLGLLVALILLIFTLNFYFLSHLNDSQNGGTGRDGTSLHSRPNSKTSLLNQVRRKVKQLKPVYLNRNPRYYSIRNKVWRNFEPKPYDNATIIWDISFWVCIKFIFQIKKDQKLKLQISNFSGQTTTKFIQPSIQQWAN